MRVLATDCKRNNIQVAKISTTYDQCQWCAKFILKGFIMFKKCVKQTWYASCQNTSSSADSIHQNCECMSDQNLLKLNIFILCVKSRLWSSTEIFTRTLQKSVSAQQYLREKHFCWCCWLVECVFFHFLSIMRVMERNIYKLNAVENSMSSLDRLIEI